MNKTAEEGGVKFKLVITGGDDRIVPTGEGLYGAYGEKALTCDPGAKAEALGSVITIEGLITFEFQAPDDPADPYLLPAWSSQAAFR